MKNLFITLFLFGMSMAVCSQDYYWYKGTKVPLVRGCRRYIIYEDDKLSESDKSHITYSEDVFYDEIPNLKWGTTSAHAVINDTAHVHYSTISYRKDGDYYDNMFITHRFYVKLKNQEDLPLLQELAAQNNAEIEESGDFPAWYILRCKLDAPKNALELANLFYETTDLFSATEPEIINAFSREFPKTIKSLCDEWNVLHKPFECIGPNCFPQTIIYRLSADTLIQDKHYVKLMSEEGSSTTYKGALREGTNRDIYYVPENSTNEYLIYAFNAQVGDELENVWLGGEEERDYCINAHNATVIEISNSNPRIFTLEIIPTTSYEDKEIYPYRMNWIEGIGMSDGPVGSYDRNQLCTSAADMGVYSLLCAYMEGEQVYVSESGEKYGCEYNVEQPRLPSLCDEWNVLEYRYNSYWGGQDEFHTLHYTQKTDTFITNQRYAKLYKENNYLGALREGNNADIYYIPSDSTHEYLLYAFNAHVGDTLKNVWLGFQDEKNHLPFQNVIVKEIQTTNPRTFVLDVERKFINDEIVHGELKWLEGIGFLSSPDGGFFDPLAGGFFYNVLCAYMEGEQVYTSEMGQKYGCYYDGDTQQDRLPSLCDEWNVLMDSGFELGPVYGEIWTNGFKVQGDTIINNIIYSRLLFADGHQKKQRESREWVYYGALREAANAEIYFIPAGQNKEYLLYAFNAQIGDRMNNLYIMDDYKEWNVWAIVKEISGNEIILDFYEQLDDREDVVLYNYTWVKGIGAKRSMFQPLPIHIGGGVVNFLLCAYNDEKHIYTSEFGEKYGCYYDGEKPQAMFPSDTRWHYRHSEYGGPDANYNFTLHPVDTIINNTHYMQIGWNLFRSEGAKVWLVIDSMGTLVERLVYDFDLQVGDSIRKLFYNEEIWSIYNEENRSEQDYEFPRYYAKVTKVEKITLADGRLARRLSYDYRPDDIEHIGSVEGILASLNFEISTCGCVDHFQCCTCGDELLYEVGTGACDTFFIKDDTPRDTIPLYKDGPGSSTVQPVDPNQIVAVLQMDVLSIFEHIGKEIGYKLTVLSSSENASASRRMVKSDTFEQSVSVSLAESGTYMLELTNPDWDYTIVGTFEYNSPHGIEPVETSVPAAQKILQNGQLLIRKGDKIYTLTGVQIQ